MPRALNTSDGTLRKATNKALPKQQAANATGDRVVGGVVGVAVVDGGYRALHFRLILLPRLLRT